MQLSRTTLRVYEYALAQHFFSSFRSRKKCEETTRLAKGTWNRAGFYSSPGIIGYPAATSGTRINRIPVAIPDIQFNRVCDVTRGYSIYPSNV